MRLAVGKTRGFAAVARVRRGFCVAVADAFPIGNVAVELAVSTVGRGGCRSRVARRVTIEATLGDSQLLLFFAVSQLGT